MSAHIFYLLFPDNCATAVVTKLIIDKPVHEIFGRKAMRIKVVFMLIDSSYEVICYPDIKSRSGILAKGDVVHKIVEVESDLD